MKKILISLAALFLVLPFAWAVPANPNPYKYTQPDGSVIILQNHGDEFFHWTTDAAGRIVERGADGFYRPSGLTQQDLAARSALASENRRKSMVGWSSYEHPFPTNFGNRKVLCIIANFADSTFIVPDPNKHFSDMLNQEGYSFNGSIGSVRDYYIDNSRGQYIPQFDVYGPVTLSKPSAYYKQTSVANAILEACDSLGTQINYADYDTDNDGNLDMVLFYYPGHNEAEGGGPESIWPHQSTLYFGTRGGKRIVRYFCTSELRGPDGTEPASIGTTCHEFAHSLGLPDFYDTDYAAHGYNLYTSGPYDLMTMGPYNDDGRRPPYMNAVERNMLGWMDYPEMIATPGEYALGGVQDNVAYQFETAVPGEYYILESRNGNKWDSAIPSGLLVYHIDKSDRIIGEGMTAELLWKSTNKINVYLDDNGGHPCFNLIPSVDVISSWSEFVFPGLQNVTSLVPVDWDDNPASISLSSIFHDGTKSHFTVTVTAPRTVTGTVTDTGGKPVSGVEIVLTPSVAPFDAAPSQLSTSLSCITDDHGTFTLTLGDGASLNQILTARKDGYISAYANLSISSRYTVRNIVLLQQGEDNPTGLYKYDPNLEYLYPMGPGISGNLGMGVLYSPEELATAGVAGGLLKTVTFMGGAKSFEDAYLLICIQGEDMIRKKITSQYVPDKILTIDVSDENIVIPAGKSLILGYGFTGLADGENPFYSYFLTYVNRNAYMLCGDFLTSDDWVYFPFYPLGDGNYGYAELLLSATVTFTQDMTFATLGVSYIRVDAGVPAVAVAAGKSLRKTTWYLDGTTVTTPPAITSLSAGSHSYMVRLEFYDGTTERVYFDVDVE